MAAAAGALILSVLACNITAATPAPVTNAPAALNTATVGVPEQPTPTFTLGPTATTACTLDAVLLADVTVLDGTVFQPNTSFTKTWRVQNTGTCDWKTGSQLVYVSGDAMSGPGAVGVSAVPAGASAEISVNFTSPADSGTYKSYWQMRSPEGTLYGALLFVEIVVPGPAASQWPVIAQGDKGPRVYAVQYLLRANGYTLAADGLFGPGTLVSVKDFQMLKGLVVDGVVGENTWQALIDGQTVATGAQGEAVKAVQYLLNNLFGYSLTVDGKFGPATHSAVVSFQTMKSLKADGIVGPKTWKALVSP